MTKLCVLCGKDGQVLAAHPVDLRVSGEDGPINVQMIAGDGQAVEIIDVPKALTKLAPSELFRSHRVQAGKFVEKKA